MQSIDALLTSLYISYICARSTGGLHVIQILC